MSSSQAWTTILTILAIAAVFCSSRVGVVSGAAVSPPSTTFPSPSTTPPQTTISTEDHPQEHLTKKSTKPPTKKPRPTPPSKGENPPHKHTLDAYGRPLRSPDAGTGYVIGGQPTGRGKWPWVVSVHFNNYSYVSDDSVKGALQKRVVTRIFVCGGVYIDKGSRRWVLTAAHCVHNAPVQLYVTLGIYNQTAQDEVNSIPVKKVIVHPGYDRDSSRQHDIALLELLWRPDTSSDDVGALKLPNSWNKWFTLHKMCYIVGWGRFDPNIDNLSEVLLERNVSIISNHACQARWDQGVVPEDIYESNVCVDEVGGTSACQGDSGSPLHCQLSTGTWVVAGIASWGSMACSKYPSVYTRITSYLPWIDHETRETELKKKSSGCVQRGYMRGVNEGKEGTEPVMDARRGVRNRVPQPPPPAPLSDDSAREAFVHDQPPPPPPLPANKAAFLLHKPPPPPPQSPHSTSEESVVEP